MVVSLKLPRPDSTRPDPTTTSRTLVGRSLSQSNGYSHWDYYLVHRFCGVGEGNGMPLNGLNTSSLEEELMVVAVSHEIYSNSVSH